MIQSNYEVEVLINGHPAKEYFHEGNVYIEGREGTPFSVKIRNNGYRRIVAIPTIDGISVLNAKKGNFDGPGYIIDGYSQYVVSGWRKSDKEVAEFYFSSPEKSYTNQLYGERMNIGVIGVAIFREKIKMPEYFKHDHIHQAAALFRGDGIDGQLMRDSNNIKMSAMSMNANVNNVKAFKADLGTGWGETKKSEVQTADFDREASPDSVMTIYYNSRKGLEEMGVEFNKPVYVTPQAFPDQYCPPPK